VSRHPSAAVVARSSGDKAGETYKQVAECYRNAKSAHEAATHLCNAAACYKKSNVGAAITCLRDAIGLYVGEGRFSVAAKQQKEIAELLEAETDFEGAMVAYQEAVRRVFCLRRTT
jgi:hypothetical protein